MEHEDFVTFEQAKNLKDLGFDWECNHYYQDNDQSLHVNFYENFNKHSKLNTEDEKLIKVTLYSAPTLSQVQKWLREVKGIHVYSHITSQPELKGKHYWEITSKNGEVLDSIPYFKLVNSYEQALSAGIDKALELLK